MSFGPDDRRNRLRRAVLVGKEKKITIEKSISTIGRSPNCDIVLADYRAISFSHCSLFMENESVYICDNNSRNGTYVNKKRIIPDKKTEAFDGDLITLADVSFTLKVEDRETESEMQKNTRVISFYSVEGGAGKTTLSLSLANVLCQLGCSVLYVDAENINTFQVNLNNTEFASSSLLKSMRNYENMSFRLIAKQFGNAGFSFFPPIYGSLEMQDIEFDSYLAIIQLAKISGMYDYVLVDSDSCCNSKKTELFSLSDQVFLVHRGFKESLKKIKVLGLLVELNNSRFVQVENGNNEYCDFIDAFLPSECSIIKKMISSLAQ